MATVMKVGQSKRSTPAFDPEQAQDESTCAIGKAIDKSVQLNVELSH